MRRGVGFVAVVAVVAGCSSVIDATGAASSRLTRVVALSASAFHTCALRDDGTVACWGRGPFGMLGGDGARDGGRTVVASGVAGATRVATGFGHSCAALDDGRLVCWGALPLHEFRGRSVGPTVLEGVTGVVSMGASSTHDCAALTDGRVMCWGLNAFGALGNGERRTDFFSPVAVSALRDAVEVTVGVSLSCARRRDGTVWCWGANPAGQLGDGTRTDRATPVQARGIADATDVSAGASHVCAVRAGGAVVCWGSLGADGEPAAVPGLTDVCEVASGWGYACARRCGGVVLCWGANDQGQLGDGTRTAREAPVPVRGLDDAVHLAAGHQHTCAARRGGSVVCWGNDGDGRLGGPRGEGVVLVTVPAPE